MKKLATILAILLGLLGVLVAAAILLQGRMSEPVPKGTLSAVTVQEVDPPWPLGSQPSRDTIPSTLVEGQVVGFSCVLTALDIEHGYTGQTPHCFVASSK